MFLYRRTVYYQFHDIEYKSSKLKFLLVARSGHYSARPMARVRRLKSEREETKEPFARSRVPPLSSEGFQEMVGTVAGL